MFQPLCAQSGNNKIEVIAKNIEGTKEKVNATDGVVVYYQDSIIKATSVSYDKESKVLVLDGEIEMIGYEGIKEQSNHMEINTETKEVKFETLFLVSQNDVWLFSDKASRSNNKYTLGRSVLSSCDIENPLWKISFARSKYNSEKKYMKLYDVKAYFLDVPFFYSPYLAFSTNNQRSSGLLFPLFGHTEEEGVVYEQPIFWAISPSMDMEFNPQLRTDRSIGLYTTWRFVDSNHSSGKLRVGYFRDSDAYRERKGAKDQNHYGLEFMYDSQGLFDFAKVYGFLDGLYVDITLLNDIDYINLQKTSLFHFGLTPLQESKLNYYYYNNDYYIGVNAKYFIDTRKEDNSDTLQIVPSINAHKYLSPLYFKNLTYSLDAHINNFYREQGATLSQAELKIPFEFSESFFDDFLKVSIGEELYYSKFYFGNSRYRNDEFGYYSNIHKIKMYTDLTKKYKNMTHVLQPSIEYIKPGDERENPVAFTALEKKQKKLFAVGLPEEQYRIGVQHYLYDESTHLKFFQRLNQIYYPNRVYNWGDLENEMQYNWTHFSMYNNFSYSYEFGKIRESSTMISLYRDKYFFSLGHTYKNKLPDDVADFELANDMFFDFNYRFSSRISLNGGLTYSLDKATSRQWRFGGKYEKDCWTVDASMRQDITPRPTGYTKDNSFYIQFNFIPFGEVGTGSR